LRGLAGASAFLALKVRGSFLWRHRVLMLLALNLVPPKNSI
jgi:hypothetical protein